MAYAHITLSHEFPAVEMEDFVKCTTQAICDATGKPEAYILVTASRENLIVGLLPQSQVFVQLTIIGIDDPFDPSRYRSLSADVYYYIKGSSPHRR